jgi:hypothetical protein
MQKPLPGQWSSLLAAESLRQEARTERESGDRCPGQGMSIHIRVIRFRFIATVRGFAAGGKRYRVTWGCQVR